MRKQLFDHIKSLLPEEVQHVDLWNEQLRYIQSETPFSMPAVFVEFASIPWTRLANSVRDGEVRFTPHIVSSAVVGEWNECVNNFCVVRQNHTYLGVVLESQRYKI